MRDRRLLGEERPCLPSLAEKECDALQDHQDLDDWQQQQKTADLFEVVR